MDSTPLSRRKLFEIAHSGGYLNDSKLCLEKLIHFVSQHYGISEEEIHIHFSKSIRSFISKCWIKWKSTNRTLNTFLRNYGDWLDSSVFSEKDITLLMQSIPGTSSQLPAASAMVVGRPSKDWQSLSKRSKQRKANVLLSQTEPPELVFAASQGVYKKNPDLKYVLNFTLISPSRPTKVRKLISNPVKTQEAYTPDEALSLLLETDMTKQSYQTIRTMAKHKNVEIYPSYNEVREAKKKCYPGNITIKEDSAKVPLQNLLDHTALRIIQEKKEAITEVVESLEDDEQLSCKLVCKWGFDGSSSQSEYKQRFSSSDQSDESLFCTTMVPLQLISGDRVLWENPVPSSTRFCRPVHLQFSKETTELSQKENRLIGDEINSLQPMDVTLDISYEVEADLNRKADLQVTYDLHLTMVDQKVINALTETKSSMRCYICGATPKQFNNIEELPSTDEEYYKYGLSPLHKWIRCFEMMLHIAYRIPVKKWRISSDQDKKLVAERKQQIHDRFKAELGLKVDEPKQGAGNTNDGNTARRAFEHDSLFADICGLDESLVHRLHMILVALSCKLPLSPDKFGVFCRGTAKLHLQLYPWFRMPVSVHVLLIHGAKILSSSVLPIGMMSEEAQEARNKDNKLFRRRHARKTSRIDNMSDVFHRLMVTSDIVVSSRSIGAPKSRSLPREVQEMVKASCSFLDNESSDSDSE